MRDPRLALGMRIVASVVIPGHQLCLALEEWPENVQNGLLDVLEEREALEPVPGVGAQEAVRRGGLRLADSEGGGEEQH